MMSNELLIEANKEIIALKKQIHDLRPLYITEFNMVLRVILLGFDISNLYD